MVVSSISFAIGLMILIASPDFVIEKGSLVHQSDITTQTVSVVNKTGRKIGWLTVQCGFYKDDQLLVSAYGGATDVEPEQKAFIEVISLAGAQDATRTECRVASK